MAESFSSLFEFLPIGAYRSAPDGSQLRANLALVRLNGYDTEAQMLQAVRDIGSEWYVMPGRRAEFSALMEAEGRVVGFESEIYRHRSRERIWVSENAHAVRDGDGQLRFFEGTVEDISERVAARDALWRSQQELRQIVELMPGMVYRVVVLPDGYRRTTFVSPGVRELLGVGPEVLMRNGRYMDGLRHEDDRTRVAGEVRAAGQAEQGLGVEYRVRLEDGQVKWLHMISAAAPPEDGHRVRVGLALDITARKQAEEALRANGELWKRALDSAGDGVWDWDLQSGVEQFSPNCLALYGFVPGELPDTPAGLDARTHPDDLATMRQAREDHLAGRTPTYVNEHRVQCKDGQWKRILSRGIVIDRAPDGTPLRMIGTHTDVTPARQAQALRHERDRAAAASQAKSELLSRVSHELRTPLNAILGFTQLLSLDPGVGAGARQRSWIRQVLDSGQHLLTLMDDILDLSSAQTGQLRVAPQALLLQPVLQEALGMVSGAAAAAGVSLFDETPAGPAVHADRRRLLQILGNLLSNAIKYNRAGGWVRLQLQVDAGTLTLRVADSGPGLNAEQRQRLFQPFERAGAQHGTVPGTGLGLALSRQLAEAMGGSLEVDSAAGQGAVFALRLPVA